MSSPAERSLGSLLRHYRQTAALSQEELAERSSVSVRTISDLERGIRDTARLETVRLLATGLGLDAERRASLVVSAIRDVVADLPPPPVSGRAPLPHPPNDLVGRGSLVASIVNLLEERDNRIVTLTGPGGVGKTRVAIEAAHQWAGRDDAPVAFVPLAAVTDSGRVPFTIAQILGLAETADSPEERVLSFFAQQDRMLVVLDNFEHLLPASVIATQIVERSPGVTLLVTSRARLRLSLEREVPVPPLELPDAAATDDEAITASSLQLFVERSKPGSDVLPVSSAEIETVAAICRRLEGLPLAIELAAARMRVMSAATLLTLLEKRLPILTGGNRDQPQRQHSMRETIHWSYRLLDQSEQRLFRWLSVYVDGFSDDSVAGTGVAIGLLPVETYDALDGLLESGLLQRTGETGHVPRFRMLETIREFGLDELLRLGELDAARESHVQIVLAYCSEGATLPVMETSMNWLARMEVEDANFNAAFDYVCETQSPQVIMRFVSIACQYWEYRGPVREGAVRLRNVVRTFPADPAIETVHALQWTAGLSTYAGDYEHARQITESALSMAIDLGDRRAQTAAMHILAWNAELTGNVSESTTLFEQVSHEWRALGESDKQAQISMLLGGHAFVRGDYADARRLERVAEDLFICNQSAPSWLSSTAWYLGIVDMAEGKWHDAALQFAHSLEYLLKLPARTQLFKPMVHLADVASTIGEFATAAKLLGCGDVALKNAGTVLFPLDMPAWERATSKTRSALGEEVFDELHETARDLGPEDWLRLAAEVVDCAENQAVLSESLSLT